MKKIELTRGYYALVDDCDYQMVAKYKWHLGGRDGYWYAQRKAKRGKKQHGVLMHREILGLTERHVLADHINGNGLDNRRSNLRIADKSSNGANRKLSKNSTSGFKGVTLDTHRKTFKWKAAMQVKKKFIYLGLFKSKIEAAKAYDTAAKKYFGEYARTNFK